MLAQFPRALAAKAHDWLGGNDPDWSLPASRAAALIRSATGGRLVFSYVIGLAATAWAPASWLAAWLAAVTIWELVLRRALEDAFLRPREDDAMRRLAAIHFLGGLIYVAFPFLVWSPAQPLSILLAAVFVCVSANHAFVYFASNRSLLFSSLVPLLTAGIAAPLTADRGDLTLLSCAGALGTVVLVFASAMIGRDRRVLLKALSEEHAARVSADAANAQKSRFLATVTHELRTPLNAIIGYAELIEESAERQTAKDAHSIRSAAHGLLDQINTILEASRLEAGAVTLERAQCDLNELLADACIGWEPLAVANNNTLRLFVLGRLGDARIDARMLTRCLARLVSNAAKFTTGGEITLLAERRRGAGGDVLAITVKDTGAGIAPDVQARLFEPFVQADMRDARRHDGAGLGLWHARLLAHAMGGDITCRSTPGAGSAFTLTLAL